MRMLCAFAIVFANVKKPSAAAIIAVRSMVSSFALRWTLRCLSAWRAMLPAIGSSV
jgi:hypothetical protein